MLLEQEEEGVVAGAARWERIHSGSWEPSGDPVVSPGVEPSTCGGLTQLGGGRPLLADCRTGSDRLEEYCSRHGK